MHVNSAGTLLVRESVQPIVPMHALPLLGCEINWNDRGIHVRHPAMGVLPVRLRDGTLLVIRLIAEYERFLMRHQAARSASERMWQQAVGQSDTTLTTSKEWFGKHLRFDTCGELELQTVVKVLFPGLPVHLAAQVAASPTFDPSCVPFNRRAR